MLSVPAPSPLCPSFPLVPLQQDTFLPGTERAALVSLLPVMQAASPDVSSLPSELSSKEPERRGQDVTQGICSGTMGSERKS